jgi:nicotinic acid phosphoribosyltransferase
MVLSFDLYFRKNPFAGEFTIFGGLEECIRFIANFKITEEEIKFLQTVMPTCEVGLLVLSKTWILLREILHYVKLKNICTYC